MSRLTATATLVLTLAACAPTPPAAESTADLTAHGEYLVTQVAFCGGCHTPWVDGAPDPSRAFQGAPTGMDAPHADFAPPIAGVPAHFTDEQFAHFLETGVRPDGSETRSPMPRYRFNARDARAITAYLKTIPRAPQ